MNVICISGKAQHGKDTFAGFLRESLIAAGKSVLLTHYADLVKYVCKTFFDWNGEKDEAGRTLLQQVGTEMFRAMDQDYWVKFVCSVLKACPDKWDFVLIPDCRFPNEISCMRDAGFSVIHINVVRPGFDNGLTNEQSSHSSETALDSVQPDITVINDGARDQLCNTAREFLRVNFGISAGLRKSESGLAGHDYNPYEYRDPSSPSELYVRRPRIHFTEDEIRLASFDTGNETIIARDAISSITVDSCTLSTAEDLSDRIRRLEERLTSHMGGVSVASDNNDWVDSWE